MNREGVLLVDDEEELVVTLQERLRFRGIEALVATSGADALRIVREAPVAVVVLDLKMPGMTGFEVLRHLREHDPRIRTILVTGHGRTEADPLDPAGGEFEVLMKPFSFETLVEKIRTRLDEFTEDRP
jgi:DNA-binding NtrC family response regulator